MLPPGLGFAGLIDSGLWIDIEPLPPPPGTQPVTSLQEQTQGIMSFINPAAIIPQKCAEEYAGEEWKCVLRARPS